MLNVVILQKKTPLSANTLLAKKPTGDCYSKIKHLCNFCFNTCLTVFVVLNSLRLLRHLWLHRDNYIVLINQGNK